MFNKEIMNTVSCTTEKFKKRKLAFESAGLNFDDKEKIQIYFPKSKRYVTFNELFNDVDDNTFKNLLYEFIECQKELEENK